MATTADYLNKLVEQKNTLADNLVIKGITATHDETLETLVPKVLDISGGESYDYGINFNTHNIASDLTYGTNYGSTQIDGEKVYVNVNSGLNTNWYLLASMIPLKRNKIYKIIVKNFTGYGRIGISSYGNGGYPPYNNEGRNAISTDFNSEINDNHLFSCTNPNDLIRFMVIPSSNTDITNCGLWYCSDENRDDVGTEGFTFELELYESV